MAKEITYQVYGEWEHQPHLHFDGKEGDPLLIFPTSLMSINFLILTCFFFLFSSNNEVDMKTNQRTPPNLSRSATAPKLCSWMPQRHKELPGSPGIFKCARETKILRSTSQKLVSGGSQLHHYAVLSSLWGCHIFVKLRLAAAVITCVYSVRSQCGTRNEGGKVQSDPEVRQVNNRYTLPSKDWFHCVDCFFKEWLSYGINTYWIIWT